MTEARFQIPKDDLPAFLACLGIGTLQAILDGVLLPEVGIWTLGAPRTWKPLNDESYISREIMEVFQTSDELSALKQLAPDQFDLQVKNLINQLQKELSKNANPSWHLEWILDAKD
jgi:hypothetical protein